MWAHASPTWPEMPRDTGKLTRAGIAQQARKVTEVPHFPAIEVRNVRSAFFGPDEFDCVLKNLPAGLRPVAESGI